MTSVPRHTKKRNPDIEWGFHAVIPRIVRTEYKGLTPAQKWLYVCLKDLCGEHGTCFRTLPTLVDETSLSLGTLSQGIDALVRAGLITAEKKKRATHSSKGVWHITIVDIWQANGNKHPTKHSTGNGEFSLNENSHGNSQQKDGEFSFNEREFSFNETAQSCEDASHVPGDAQNEVVSSINRSSIKKEEEPPPPLTFPSEKTLPRETLFPSKQIPPPALSNVPPDVQAVIDAYLPISPVPVDVKKPKFIAAATFLARFQPTTEKLSACRKWMIEHDKKGRFNDHVPNLVEISYDYGNWKADMARKQDQAQPSKPGVGVSGKPKIDTTSDDYRAFAQAMGGN